MPDFNFEKQLSDMGLTPVGVDEVGRGCLAGPVVAAAVLIPSEVFSKFPNQLSAEQEFWREVNDSKKLKPAKREELSNLIATHAQVSIAWCTPEEIDRWNILRASMTAMRKALLKFSEPKGAVLVDGNQDPYQRNFLIGQNDIDQFGFTKVKTLVKGDSLSISIAAASVVAKVYRDKWMAEFDQKFPGYSFGVHKGYSTKLHYQAIEKLGPCPIHRRSFAPFTEQAEFSL